MRQDGWFFAQEALAVAATRLRIQILFAVDRLAERPNTALHTRYD
jgi:hypothetical protein